MNQVNEIQLFKCVAVAGTFTLAFKGKIQMTYDTVLVLINYTVLVLINDTNDERYCASTD